MSCLNLQASRRYRLGLRSVPETKHNNFNGFVVDDISLSGNDDSQQLPLPIPCIDASNPSIFKATLYAIQKLNGILTILHPAQTILLRKAM